MGGGFGRYVAGHQPSIHSLALNLGGGSGALAPLGLPSAGGSGPSSDLLFQQELQNRLLNLQNDQHPPLQHLNSALMPLQEYSLFQRTMRSDSNVSPVPQFFVENAGGGGYGEEGALGLG